MRRMKKEGQRNDLEILKNRISLALVKKKEIEEKIVLLHETFEKGKLNYLDYKELLDSHKILRNNYSDYIKKQEEIISDGNIELKNSLTRHLPITLIILLMGLILMIPVIENSGLTGLFGVQELEQNTTWGQNIADLDSACSVMGDLDGDGRADLVISGRNSSFGNEAHVYINDGTTLNLNGSWGNLTAVFQCANALADFDNDGDLDYFQAGQAAGSTYYAQIYLNNGTGLVYSSFWSSGLESFDLGSVVVGDIDNDGDYDIVGAGNFGGGTNPQTKVFLNTGGGFSYSLTWTTNLEGVSSSNNLVLGDYDKDCDLDLVLFGNAYVNSSWLKTGKYYQNTGSGFVENSTFGAALSRFSNAIIATGDLDNDGDLDLIASGPGYSNTSDVCNQDLCVLDTCDQSGGWGMCMGGICCDMITPCGLPGYDPACTPCCSASGVFPCFSDPECYYCSNVGTPQGTPNCPGGTNAECSICASAGVSCTNNWDCWPQSYLGKVYLNNNGFSENQNITPLYTGGAVLGDVDNDGDLELFMAGYNASGRIERTFYDNNGGLLIRNSTLEGTIEGHGTAVTLFNDLTNNSKLDLLVAGSVYNKTDYCIINDICDQSDVCILDTCGNLVPGQCDVTGVPCGSDPDCYYCQSVLNPQGSPTCSPSYGGTGSNSDCWLCTVGGNQCTDNSSCTQNNCATSANPCTNNQSCWTTYPSTDVYINNVSTTNSLPNSPNTFYTNYSGGKLILNWSGASDSETATAGLYYNLRVGTTSGSDNIFSGYYPRSSNPTAGYFGNLMGKNFINLSLPETKYYWSVQTIDPAMGMSAWSTEQFYNFTLECGAKNDDVFFADNLTVTNSTTCLNITGSDITVDCAGNFMIGNGSGTAIYVINKNNVIIQNCNFINFTDDIVFFNVSDSLIDGVDVIVNITNSNGDNITNSNISELYITNSTNIYIENSIINYSEIVDSTDIYVNDSLMRNYSLDNVTYLSFENSSYGSVKFLQPINENGSNLFGNSTADVKWSNLLLAVDSASKSGFNVSANVSVSNVGYVLPKPYVNISGNFTICNSSTDPSCYNLSYSGNVFVFNVSHFTEFKVKEGAYLISNNTWSQNLPDAVLDGTLILIDLNNDSLEELHITGYESSSGGYYNAIYNNTGSTFVLDAVMSSPLTGVSYSGASWGDYDLDGDSDLVYCGFNGGYVGHAYKNNGPGVAMTQDSTSSSNIDDVIYCSTTMGDVDLDGDLDLAIQGQNSSSPVCNVYTNDNGTFVFNSTYSDGCSGKYYGAIRFLDVNNDSMVDLLSVGTLDGFIHDFQVLINNGSDLVDNSTWKSNLAPEIYARFSYDDLNHDGLRDIIAHGRNLGGNAQTTWYQNNGSGFDIVTNHDLKNVTRGGICIADLNNDGWEDVYMSGSDETLGINGVYHADIYLSSNGTGLFRNERFSVNLTPMWWSACAMTEFNNGNHVDLVASGSALDAAAQEYSNVEVLPHLGDSDIEDNERPTGIEYETPEVTGCSGTSGQISSSKGDGGGDDDGFPPGGEITFQVKDENDGIVHSIVTSADGGGGMVVSDTVLASSTYTFYGSCTDNYEITYTYTDPGTITSDPSLPSDTLLTEFEFTSDVLSLNAGTVTGDDCYLSTDGTQPGSDSIACFKTGNWSTLNMSITSLQNYTLDVYYIKNITTMYGSGTLSHQYVGKVQNLTPIGNGTIVATSWVLGDYNTSAYPILLVQNVDNLSTQHNYTVEVGRELHVSTLPGTYDNRLIFRVVI